MAYKPLTMNEWWNTVKLPSLPQHMRQEASLMDYIGEYNNYANSFQANSSVPTVTPNTPQPTPGQPTSQPTTDVPGSPIVPTSPVSNVNPDFAPPDPFNNFEEAGRFGANQAMGIYSMPAPQKSFGLDTQNTFSMGREVADTPYLSNAQSAVDGTLSEANPYFSAMGAVQTGNPNNFNAFTQIGTRYGDMFKDQAREQSPYRGQIASAYSANPFAGDVNYNQSNPYMANTAYNSNIRADTNWQNPFQAESNFNNPYQAQTEFNNPFQADTNYSPGVSVSQDYQNPFQAGTDFNNPFLANTQDSNPFLQGFQNFGNQQNQYFDRTVDRAMDKVSDRVNSQFALGGRTGSGSHAGVLTESLGDVAIAGRYAWAVNPAAV